MRILWIPLVSLALAACGSSDSGGTGSGGPAVVQGTPVEQKDFTKQYVDTVCGSIKPCCDAASVPYDDDSCRTRATQEATELQSPGKYHVAYDAQLAGNCIATLQSLAGSCSRTADQAASETAACGQIQAGQLGVNEVCEIEAECSAGLVCTHKQPTGPATCQTSAAVAPHAAAGDACGTTCTTDSCEPATSAVCWLSDGLSCGSPQPYEPTVCLALLGQGAACPLPSEIDRGPGPICSAGLVCVAATGQGDDGGFDPDPMGTCQPLPTVGQPCPQEQCATDSYCGYTPDGSVCLAYAAEGAACDTMGKVRCAMGAHCKLPPGTTSTTSATMGTCTSSSDVANGEVCYGMYDGQPGF